MQLVGIFEVLVAFFKFPGQLTELARMLQSTPEEDHQKLLEKVKVVFDESKSGGRPS